MSNLSRFRRLMSVFGSAGSSDSRTQNYFRQVRLSLVMRLLTVGLSFATTAILLRAMPLEQYGIWALLISVQTWINLFDVGIGNGLRTRVAENLAHGRLKEAARNISIAYAVFALIFLLLMVSLFPTVATVDWQTFLNVTTIASGELRASVGVAVLFTSLILVTNLINPVAAAVQRSSYTAVAGAIQSAFFVLLALVMLLTGWGSALTFLVLRGASNVVVNVGFTIWFYSRRPEIKPHVTTDLRGARGLISFGFGYFIIQIAMLVMFSTDQFMIVKLFGPEQVPQYDVTFKLFNLFVTIHLIFAAPLWSAYTEAYQKGEFGWISHTIRGQVKIVALLALGSAALIPLARPIIALWTGDRVDIAYGLVGLMALSVVLTMWNNTFGAFLNGTGHLRPQIIVATIGAILNIPLSIFFARTLAFGVNGILLATIVCIALQSVVLSGAVFEILRHRRAPQPGGMDAGE
jgi:O-antigen/teichoic acid export membrane protein